jgi:hypothetical protein
MYAKAGFYIQPYGGYLIKEEKIPEWDKKFWKKSYAMNSAFRSIIGKAPRIKETPFVFGGNMIIHRELFEKVCFDPGITRGEDIDYLVNSRMMGFKFFLDNELSIRHLPPKKDQPDWLRLREDILRFLYMRKKLSAQKLFQNKLRHIVTAEELDPYPGQFLKPDLEEKIIKTNEFLGALYLKKGDKIGYEECLKNIKLIDNSRKMDAEEVFLKFLEIQKMWQKLIKICRDFKNF